MSSVGEPLGLIGESSTIVLVLVIRYDLLVRVLLLYWYLVTRWDLLVRVLLLYWY